MLRIAAMTIVTGAMETIVTIAGTTTVDVIMTTMMTAIAAVPRLSSRCCPPGARSAA
jgi:hypothetical protein